MDGRLLALARAEKDRQRARSEEENARRCALAYERIPALRQIDADLAALVTEFAGAALGGGEELGALRERSLDLRASRAEMLVEHGFDAAYLDGCWSCPRCRDTGFVEGRPCQCLLALYEKERARDLSALLKMGDESFESFDLRWYDNSAVDPATGMTCRRQMEQVFSFCRAYANSFGERSVNLLFQGGTGLGKTYLSACIARVVSQKGFSVVYETTVAAMGAFESQKFHAQPEAEAKVRQLLSCDLLILDDLGTEMVTEFTKSALYTLINTRSLAKNRKTIVSTNLTAAELSRLYTPQICSRLYGDYQDLPFVGKDIRMLKKEAGWSGAALDAI